MGLLVMKMGHRDGEAKKRWEGDWGRRRSDSERARLKSTCVKSQLEGEEQEVGEKKGVLRCLLEYHSRSRCHARRGLFARVCASCSGSEEN